MNNTLFRNYEYLTRRLRYHNIYDLADYYNLSDNIKIKYKLADNSVIENTNKLLVNIKFRYSKYKKKADFIKTLYIGLPM